MIDSPDTDGIDGALRAALTDFAALPVVVAASDFDGCVAPLVDDPAHSAPDPRSMAALTALAQAPDTTAALISGRARGVLSELSGARPPLVLVGSHGAEFESGFDDALTPEKTALLNELVAELQAISARRPGTLVETKPASTTLHVRNASEADGEAALAEALAGPAAREGVQVTHGKAVIELAVIETSKGRALDVLRRSAQAQAVLYLGDDVTDEKAFAHLRGPAAGGRDIGIKVGPGETGADFRVPDTDAVAAVLELLAALR